MSEANLSEFAVTGRNQVKRLPDRAHYDKESVYRIVDEALYCHVGFVQDGQPFVLPIIHARVEDTLILHGAKASRLLKHIAAGQPVCVTVTLVDGLVFARSVFHHSMNYRSAVLFGTGRVAESDEEKMWALQALTEHIARGRWDEARKPNARELNATTVVLLAIESAAAKTRSGPAKDDEEDYALGLWAGVLPLELSALEPLKDEHTREETAAPDYIQHYRRK